MLYAGLCVKTRNITEGDKIFMNLCISDDVPEPDLDLSDQELAEVLSDGTSEEMQNIRFPMSVGNKHVEIDKSMWI